MTFVEKFKQALIEMEKHGDFDKQIKYPTFKGIKKLSKHDKEMFEGITDEDIKKIPYIVLLTKIHSPDTLKNILCYMLSFESSEKED